MKLKHQQCRKRLDEMQACWEAACSGNSRQRQSGRKLCWLLYKQELKEVNGHKSNERRGGGSRPDERGAIRASSGCYLAELAQALRDGSYRRSR